MLMDGFIIDIAAMNIVTMDAHILDLKSEVAKVQFSMLSIRCTSVANGASLISKGQIMLFKFQLGSYERIYNQIFIYF